MLQKIVFDMLLKFSFLSAFIVFLFQFGQAQLRLPLLFSDNMVVQRNQPITVWGWAIPGASLSIEMNKVKVKAQTDLDGKWQASLPAMPAGGPYEMTILGNGEKKTFKNVMVGDVWLCSGQSNMEWVMKNSDGFTGAIAEADKLPNIRHFKVPLTSSLLPTDTLVGGTWQVGTAMTISDFTAVGYFFAKKMQEKNPNIAIGLLNSSWGGSRIEPWMSAQTLGYKDAEQQAEIMKQAVITRKRKDKKQVAKVFTNLSTQDRGMKGEQPLWAMENLDTKEWLNLRVPQLWEDYGEGYLKNLDGIVWFRKTINLTAEQAAQSATLYAGKIDDSDFTYINGQLVGSMENSYSEQRKYDVPATVLKAGQNVIAIRVVDTGGGGGIYGKDADLQLVTAQGVIDLKGDWQFNLGQYVSEDFGFSANQMPTLLYNAMIKPLQRYKIKGALWYQGESNTGTAEEAYQYRELLPQMINQWRGEWGSGEFPFLYVSLASFTPADEQPTESNWAMIRESMTQVLATSKTAQVITIDIGEADDIHPRNKKEVGERLALAAQHYANPNDNIIWQSPRFEQMEVKNGKAYITFDTFGSSLKIDSKYGYIKGFAIADKNRKFKWAWAKIEQGKVVVWHNEIKEPVAVRYGWSNNPADANLFNTEGLPVTPFRTDKW